MSNITHRAFVEVLGGTTASSFVGNAGDLFYDREDTTLRVSDGVTAGGNPVGGGPVAKGCINLNASSPTWSGTTGYTVAKSGGDGSALGGDVFYTLTFPSAYAERTDYIVNASYDGTDWVSANGAQIGIERNAGNVVFCVRRWNEDPLNLGDLMITIYNL
jgi:hypothetical protein